MVLEFDLEKGDDVDKLRDCLAEAVEWFESTARLPKTAFPRSVDLEPSHLGTDRKSVVYWVTRRRRDVSWVAHRRRDAKAKAATTERKIEGRLLGYCPDETVLDGASEAVTEGFFNWEDEPPWDLWLGYLVETSGRSYLVSWVPLSLVETVEDGIDVNPVACLFWLDELEQTLGLR